MEQHHVVSWADLPLETQFIEVMDDSGMITSIRQTSSEVAQNSNRITNRFFRSMNEINLNELLVDRNHNLLARELRVKVDLKSALGERSCSVIINAQWETSDRVGLCLVIKVDPVVGHITFIIATSLDFKNIVADTNSCGLNVTPVPNKFGTDLNVQSESIRKIGILGQDQVALSVELKVFTLPRCEVWITSASSIGLQGKYIW
mmetsp:Transcript_36740/g.89146  ORF Transcript_36740/g.89146 Transcript_36740/m.89146 type:complete len:204 (-) Transcript_36740:1517-2128(-)